MDIKDIKTTNLNPGDILVVTVDCGKMPPGRTQQYLERIKDDILSTIGTDYKVLMKTTNTHIEVLSTSYVQEEETKGPFEQWVAGRHVTGIE